MFILDKQRHYCQNCNHFFPPRPGEKHSFALTDSRLCPKGDVSKKPLRELRRIYAKSYAEQIWARYGRARWDTLRKKFIIWHCSLHNFNPNEVTLSTKCFARKCMHLARQIRNEIVVSNLREAMEIKNNHSEILIEQTKDGFRLIHAST